MIGVRSNTFNDNSGEPEQDANSALTELDKGLRSGKVGEQCEAIVRFPRLFEKYPFPILINSSFLKLADVFRMGNNFLRLWVLRVCQQSEKHLDKILNVDEFLRRVFSVLHSNDPVARALALRTLGAVAGIIPERQNVHHAIRRGLESHDNVEVDAAIYATTRFAAHSNAFAVAMCNKLSDMVECESTAAERRAKLVRALRTVHGGAVRAQGVLKLLRSLLEKFPSSSSVRAAITALTAIAADTVVHVPDQVELLLSIAMKDARSAVRRAALLGLKKLAEHAALWPAECIQHLVRAASDSQDAEHTMLCLQVMQMLVRCGAVCAGAGAGTLRSYCFDATLSADLRHAATAADVLTRVVVHCYEESLPVEGADLMLALESLVIATGQASGHIKPLRIALRCLVQLSTAEPSLYAERTAGTLGGQLEAAARSGASGERVAALLEALAALGGSPACTRSLPPALPALHALLARRYSATYTSMSALLEALAALGGSLDCTRSLPPALPALHALLARRYSATYTSMSALLEALAALGGSSDCTRSLPLALPALHALLARSYSATYTSMSALLETLAALGGAPDCTRSLPPALPALHALLARRYSATYTSMSALLEALAALGGSPDCTRSLPPALPALHALLARRYSATYTSMSALLETLAALGGASDCTRSLPPALPALHALLARRYSATYTSMSALLETLAALGGAPDCTRSLPPALPALHALLARRYSATYTSMSALLEALAALGGSPDCTRSLPPALPALHALLARRYSATYTSMSALLETLAALGGASDCTRSLPPALPALHALLARRYSATYTSMSALLEALAALGGSPDCTRSLPFALPALHALLARRYSATYTSMSALLETLAALGGAPDCTRSLPPTLPAVYALLARRTISSEDGSDDGTTLVLLCTVLFQERAAAKLNFRINNSWEDKILQSVIDVDGWTRYRVARAALRYGHHNLAANILKRLSEEAPSEAAQRWLTALYRAASADARLLVEGISGVEVCSGLWEACGDAGGAGGGAGGACAAGCGGCGACTPLAAAWMSARAAALAALAQAAAAARALCTQPPPAVAQAARTACGRVGAAAGALRRAARSLAAVARRYEHIARTAFHADRSTLAHLHISEHTFAQLAQFLERITSNQQEMPAELFTKELKATTLEELIALTPSVELSKISTKLFDNPTTNPGITHRHMEAVLLAVKACSGGAVWPRGVCEARGGAALCRVSLAPGWRAPGAEHAATLPLAHRLALRLEGVVLPPPRSKRQPPRQVKGVQITVTVTPHPRTIEKTVELGNVPAVLRAVQTVAPLRDFFSAQQLVAVAAPGLYTVAVDAAFVDQHGQLWNTGPRTSIVIKAHEDPGSKGNSQASRSRF
ncbi:unnamed protein product [Parnassius apollo]|uniref:(apollo) hypothetical protein n=1 Tax=Parnassius apollo TaxID=110799 RepID=A0A8S3WRK9_PARAO|nr:unnamed protein product [Parnassius apollo]